MSDLFSLTLDPVELVIRGTIMYLGLVLIVRFLLRRDVGSMSMADLLFIVLIADAAQNAMSGAYKSLADGAVLVAVLVLWNIVLDRLAFHSKVFRRLIEPPSVPLIKDGKWLRQNLRKEWITTEEVLAQLREHGIDSVAKVRAAYLESGGELGVIRADGKEASKGARRKRPA